MMGGACHLNVRSYYSLLRGVLSPEEIAGWAGHHGCSEIALCDLNNVGGLVRFTKACRTHGVRPIIGASVDLPDGGDLVFLPQNARAYESLCRIITYRQLDPTYNVVKHPEHISEELIVLGQDIGALKQLQGKGLRVYVELIFDGGVFETRTHECLRKNEGLPVVASNAVRLKEPTQLEIYTLLRAIDHNMAVDNVREQEDGHSVLEGVNRHNYLKDSAEMAINYQDHPSAIENTHLIAQKCQFQLELGTWHFPKVSEKMLDKRICKSSSPMCHLTRLAVAGLRERVPNWDHRYVSRLRYELHQIKALHFCDYFLIVWDIARFAKEQHIPSLGRGSAANSLVSFCLGLTHVDPIQHDLYFERFINPSRKTPPDVDLDFCWKRREKVLEYVFQRYGHRHVAMICTTVTLGLRSAFREIGRAMGLDEKELSRISKRLPHTGTIPETSEKLIKRYPACRDLPLDKEPYKSIYKNAQKIENFPRHLSVHPGGIIITEKEINSYLAQQKSANGLVVTQYDMYDIEELGLVKIDLLGNRSLSVYQDCSDILEGHGIKIPGFDSLPSVFNNENVQHLIKTGSSMGCFYIESPAMRQLLKKLNTTTFEQLTAASSVIRPGVAESGMMNQFIERNLDATKANYLHPLMKKLLSDTFGVMIYQEDVLKIAHHLAGMSLSDADLFRRAMSGKARSKAAMEALVKQFVDGCIQNGVRPDIAKEIWRQVESFAGYSFCKAHSASYAQLSFLTAYLKYYFPAVFMAAVINNGGGFYSAQTYIQEAKRLGIAVQLPCVNESEVEYVGWNNRLRIGLSQISHISHSVKVKIIEMRKKHGLYISLAHLLDKTRLSMRDAEILICCGACDCFGVDRPALLLQLTLIFDRYPRVVAERDLPQDSLFSQGSHGLLSAVQSPQSQSNMSYLDPLSVRQRMRYEIDYLDMMVSWHPVEWVQTLRQDAGRISSEVLSQYTGKKVKIIGWCIAVKSCRTKKTGAQMKFMSMDDAAGTFEVTLFPAIYKRYAPTAYGKGPFLIEGRCDEQFGVVSITAASIDRLDLGL